MQIPVAFQQLFEKQAQVKSGKDKSNLTIQIVRTNERNWHGEKRGKGFPLDILIEYVRPVPKSILECWAIVFVKKWFVINGRKSANRVVRRWSRFGAVDAGGWRRRRNILGRIFPCVQHFGQSGRHSILFFFYSVHSLLFLLVYVESHHSGKTKVPPGRNSS